MYGAGGAVEGGMAVFTRKAGWGFDEGAFGGAPGDAAGGSGGGILGGHGNGVGHNHHHGVANGSNGGVRSSIDRRPVGTAGSHSRVHGDAMV